MLSGRGDGDQGRSLATKPTSPQPTLLVAGVRAGVVILSGVIVGVARSTRYDATGLAQMEDEIRKLSVERTNRQLEVCDELTLVPALVLDDDGVTGTVQASTKVVHNELPTPTEVSR